MRKENTNVQSEKSLYVGCIYAYKISSDVPTILAHYVSAATATEAKKLFQEHCLEVFKATQGWMGHDFEFVKVEQTLLP